MNKNLISLVAIAAALSLTAGCARRNRDLPPEPPSGSTPGELGTETGDTSTPGQAVPGSRADFLQSVPTDRVYFDFDSYSLDGDHRATLDAQADWLARNPNVRVTIEGHADERGTREYNLALGDRRANAAKNYLVARGVPASRITTISWGKERPEALGSDESAWAQNRRAVTVLPQ